MRKERPPFFLTVFLFLASFGFSPKLWAAELRLSGTIPAQDVVSLALNQGSHSSSAGTVLAVTHKSNHIAPVRLQIYETSSKRVLYQKMIPNEHSLNNIQFNEFQVPLSRPGPMTFVLTLL